MVRKTSRSRGSSVIAALIVLCALIGYGLSECCSVVAVNRPGQRSLFLLQCLDFFQ